MDGQTVFSFTPMNGIKRMQHYRRGQWLLW